MQCHMVYDFSESKMCFYLSWTKAGQRTDKTSMQFV